MPHIQLQIDPAATDYGQAAEPFIWGIVAFIVIYLLEYLLILPALTRVIRRRNERNPTLTDAIERYIKLIGITLAFLIAIIVAGYGDFLAGSALVIAAVTLALGVAGQAVIGNLVSGLFLVVDPDFNVGDWIEWEDDAGVVETIRFRVTRVRTENNEVVTVPNTTLATSTVTRPYSRNQLRITLSFGVAYDTDIETAITLLREEITSIDNALRNPSPLVVVEGLGDDAIQLRVEFWLGSPTPQNAVLVRSRYIRAVKQRFDAAEIDLSPPSEHQLSGSVDLNPE